MDIINSVLIPAGTAFATALATRGSEGAIQTLNDVWELVFGNFHLYVNKKRAIREKNLDDFKVKLTNEISSIPLENIQEPPLNILGPALEASKFYIEDEAIRDMFAKLIASSMDDRKNSQVHGSYVEIIKQLSPLDAQNISILKTDRKPIAEYRIKRAEDGSFHIVHTNIFLANPAQQDIELNAISLSNITRLGLTSITYVEYINDEAVYSVFYETDLYKQLVSTSETTRNTYEAFSRMPPEQQPPIMILNTMKFNIPYILKGIIKLTPLGHSFASICC